MIAQGREEVAPPPARQQAKATAATFPMGMDRNGFLSPEEVLALFQALQEESAPPLPDIRGQESLSGRRQVFNLKWVSQWLTSLTPIRWPQL